MLEFDSDISFGTMTPLDKRLWIEGNLSVAYGEHKSDGDSGNFSMTFNPLEFKRSLRIPINNFTLHKNSWFSGLFKDQPSELVCFPYAQHFLSDSPDFSSELKDEEDLNNAVINTNFDNIETLV